MEAAFNVRRRGRGELTKLEIELCLICQKRTHEESSDASSAGLISVKDASSTRMKFHCDAYIDTIDMLNSNSHVLNDPSKKLIWHKSCYSSFTSKSHLERLKKRYEDCPGLLSHQWIINCAFSVKRILVAATI